MDPHESESGSLRSLLLGLAKAASTSPGVYLMKDAQGHVLYVGKAKNLKNRLVTYFQAQVHEIPRTELLLGRVQSFDVILTETEAEALILEATLVKKQQPKFNVRLKDDKAYPYLKIQVQEQFPRIQWTRKVLSDGARYFGPFPSAGGARQVLQLLNETFQLRDCSDNVFSHRSRPCILHQMGKCQAPCVAKVSAEQYRETLDEVIAVLEGKADRLMGQLREAMEEAADQEEFEEAAHIRDQIRNLELVTEAQSVSEAGSQTDRDVVGIAREGGLAHATLLCIRSGKLTSVKHYDLQNTDPAILDSELLHEFLIQYYLPAAKEKVLDRREILVPSPPAELEWVERALGLCLVVPDSPIQERLVSVALANAQYALAQKQRASGGKGSADGSHHGAEALEETQEKLHLQKFPRRIECYDISNIQGTDAVASRVTFIDGAPDKNLYRRYKIRTVEGANDFAMMKEVLHRRFSRVEEALPDLVVVDGGKGQLAQAVAILDELQVQGVSVVGLAKARVERDFQAKEVKSSFERIFIPNRKNPVPLLPHTRAYKLLTHVRDEAHRFAISYHRHLRSKRILGENSDK